MTRGRFLGKKRKKGIPTSKKKNNNNTIAKAEILHHTIGYVYSNC